MTAAVILAAGSSRRFGRGNKLLAPYNGNPLIVRTVEAVATMASPVFVVVGRQSRSVIAAIRQAEALPVHIIRNPEWRRGMASSLRKGIRALPGHVSRVWLCLGDMPCIDAVNWRRLLAEQGAGIDYVRPICHGIPGHPVLLSRSLFQSLCHLQGDHGARGILKAVPSSRRRLVNSGRACLNDVDTRRQLRCLPR